MMSWRNVAWMAVSTAVVAGSETMAPARTAASVSDTPWFEDVTEAMGLAELNRGGAVWVDFDGDGFIDLSVGGQLWRNREGRGFERLDLLPGHNYAAWADLDGDGYPEVLIWVEGRGGWLFRNVEGKRFEHMEGALPELPMKTSRAAAWGDVDSDGFLDLVLGGYEDWAGDSLQAVYPDVVLRNRGDNTFEILETRSHGDSTRGITLADYNNDGRVDVYISKYRLQPNLLLRNRGGGHLTDIGQNVGAAGENTDGAFGHTVGSAWGDLDNDGYLDLFVGNFSHPPVWQDRPKFLRNRGPADDYAFEDLSARAGLHWQESYASPALGDFDNDGYLDLFFTTVYPQDHGVLYRNRGNFRFEHVTAASGIHSQITYQAAWGDFDNDGQLDLVTGGRLYRNAGSRHGWLLVHLVGAQPGNREAIGAQVRIRRGNMVLTRQVESATGEMNRNDPRLHFGLGAHRGPVTLEIRWPDGSKQRVRTQASRLIRVEQRPSPGS